MLRHAFRNDIENYIMTSHYESKREMKRERERERERKRREIGESVFSVIFTCDSYTCDFNSQEWVGALLQSYEIHKYTL